MMFGFPTTEPEEPFVLDMATSMAAAGRVRIALNRGERVPDGWLLDAHERTGRRRGHRRGRTPHPMSSGAGRGTLKRRVRG